MPNEPNPATATPTAPAEPGTTADPQRRVSVTYSRAVAWNYGNKEEASVTLTETVEPLANVWEVAGALQRVAKGLVEALLLASGVALVREQVG